MDTPTFSYDFPLRKECRDYVEESSKRRDIVHSGHFMISSVADDQEELEHIDHDRDSPEHHEQTRIIQLGYDFSKVPKETKNTYQFGPLPCNQITIDASLARLFQCMSLAYQGGKVVSPKWKNFKGMKLTVKDKIRLNNAIWRTWHIQYVMRKKKGQSLIQFATPMEVTYNSHAKPEAVVMEGKYWKRRIETVVAEYKKWRAFFMEKLRLSDHPGLMWVSENLATSSTNKTPEFDPLNMVDDTTLNDFSDTLFSSLSQQPFQFPNPREIAMHATNSDMMQPGLLQLQPAFDDYMDFESLNDFLNFPKKSMVSFSGSSNQSVPQNTIEMLESADLSNFLEESVIQENVPRGIIPNNQAVDSVGAYGMASKLQEPSSVQQQSTSEHILPLELRNSSSSYPLNSIQQPANQQAILHSQCFAAPCFKQVEIRGSFPSNSNTVNLHQPPSKQSHPQNIGFVPSTASEATLNRIQQQHHQYSNHGTNSTSNPVTYTRPQISQQVKYFSPTESPVIRQDTHTNSMFQVQPRNVHDKKDLVYDSGIPIMKEPQQRAYAQLQPEQTMNNGKEAPISDASFLKQLLTSHKNIPRKRENLKEQAKKLRQAKRSFTVAQQATVSNPAAQMQALSSAKPSPHTFRKEKQSPSALEKRSSYEQLQHYSKLPQEPSSRVAIPSTSTPVKPFVQDIDMERVSLEVISPLSQDLVSTEIHQRRGSLSSEQKRRCNIKQGLVRLQQLLPDGNAHTNSKISKALLLNKVVQHLKAIQLERSKMNQEIKLLKQDLTNLQLAISSSQEMLPDTGVALPRQRAEEATNNFKTWVKQRTKQDWKFYLFSEVIRPWFDSYHKQVSATGVRDFNKSVFEWVETGCSLSSLRPSVVQSLQYLSTTTSILSNPSLLQQQIEEFASEKQS